MAECYAYINNTNEPIFISGMTCYVGPSGFTLNVGQSVCMNIEFPIYNCGALDIAGSCVPPTPTATQTPTNTPTNTITQTSTQTQTPTNTSTQTPTNTLTPTNTPTNTITQTPFITPTVTPTLTPTNSPTPSITPYPACDVAFNLFKTPAPPTVPNGFYGRITLSATSISTTTFDYGYLSYFDANTGTVTIGTPPDGNNYPIYQANLGLAGFATFLRIFSGSTDFGWGTKERSQNIFTGTTNLTSGETAYGEYDYIDVAGIRYPPNGPLSFTGGIGWGESYLYYPTVCFTPTPTLSVTATNTRTPTVTPTASVTRTPNGTPDATPTQTPTNSPTPSITASQTNTPSVTPTLTPTVTPSNTPTKTPTQTQTSTPTSTTTLTATPTQTPTFTPTATITPSKTPTQTPTDTPIYYYYQYRGFDCRFPGPCNESANVGYTKHTSPLQLGYYCDVITGTCGGLRIIGSATPNITYGNWDSARYPTRNSGVCVSGLCP